MARPESKGKTIRLVSSVTGVHGGYIDRLMEEKGYASQSEVVRAGIASLYAYEFKDYLQPRSSTNPIKDEERAEKARIEGLSDEEYNNEFIHGLVMTGTNGLKFLAFHYIQGNVKIIALSEIKKWFSDYPGDIKIAHDGEKKMPIREEMRGNFYRRTLQEYGIDQSTI